MSSPFFIINNGENSNYSKAQIVPSQTQISNTKNRKLFEF
jgi:hypothetical protein